MSRRGTLNFGVTWIGFVVRLAGQLGYFLLVARALGPHDYGIVASVTALLIVIAAFAGWGGDHVLIRHVTEAPARYPDYFGHALLMIAATALPLAAIAYALQWAMVGMAVLPFLAFAFGELVLVRINATLVAAFMAFERGRNLLLVNSVVSLGRLGACGIAILVSSPLDIGRWAVWYLAGMTLAAAATLAYTIAVLGRPRWHLARGDLALGFHFCLYYTADSAVRDMDKPLIALLAGPVAAGLYNAAFRIVDAASMPLRAMAATFYARFFRHGHQGIEHSFRFAAKLLPLTLGYAVFAALALNFGSGFLPLILGEKFHAAIPVVSRLAILPIFTALAAIGGDVLTSSGRQRTRALVMSALAVTPALLVYLLVPRFGLLGAAYAALGTAAIVATAIWTMVLMARAHARTAAPAIAADAHRTLS
ncbi:MAG: oligosaccharide flippase family protein [Stellaceae bacterium]